MIKINKITNNKLKGKGCKFGLALKNVSLKKKRK